MCDERLFHYNLIDGKKCVDRIIPLRLSTCNDTSSNLFQFIKDIFFNFYGLLRSEQNDTRYREGENIQIGLQ